VYEEAAVRIQELAVKVNELGISSPEFENVLHNTDYDALKKINDIYDIVDDLGVSKINLYEHYKETFKVFHEGMMTNREEHSKAVLLQTHCHFIHRLKPCEKRYSRYLAAYMSREQVIITTYNDYTARVYKDWPRRPTPEEELEEKKEVEKHRVSNKWKTGDFWDGLQ